MSEVTLQRASSVHVTLRQGGTVTLQRPATAAVRIGTVVVQRGGGGPELSDDVPSSISADEGSAGVSAEASRADHAHQVVTDAPGPIAVGDTANEGVSNALARADHRHEFDASQNVTWTGAHGFAGAVTFSGPQAILRMGGGQAAPTLAWGDGDTGFRESDPNVITVSLGGTARFEFNGALFGATAAQGPAIISQPSDATTPNIRPNRADTNSGIGGSANDEVFIITGGVARFTATNDLATLSTALALPGGLTWLGYTSRAGEPTTAELPTDKTASIHKDTDSGTLYLAVNDGGVIKKVALT